MFSDYGNFGFSLRKAVKRVGKTLKKINKAPITAMRKAVHTPIGREMIMPGAKSRSSVVRDAKSDMFRRKKRSYKKPTIDISRGGAGADINYNAYTDEPIQRGYIKGTESLVPVSAYNEYYYPDETYQDDYYEPEPYEFQGLGSLGESEIGKWYKETILPKAKQYMEQRGQAQVSKALRMPTETSSETPTTVVEDNAVPTYVYVLAGVIGLSALYPMLKKRGK